MNKRAELLINLLDLSPHQEGGYFKESYRSAETIKKEGIPERFSGERNIFTSIYFLLQGNDISAFHKILSDEIWHFYEGSSVRISQIDNDGIFTQTILGNALEKAETPQYLVKAGVWMAAELTDKTSYALMGCTTAPGFEYSDFILGDKITLSESYPYHKELIEKLAK